MNTKQLEKKEAILQATLQLITEQGFHATPMSQIAKEAGVAAGTIYLYFQNKEELLNALYLQIKSQLGDVIFQGISPGMPVRVAFEKIWYNGLNFYLEHPLNLLFVEQYDNSPFAMKGTQEEAHKYFQTFAELVERAKYEKAIKDLPEYVLYALYYAPVTFLIKMQRQGKLQLDEATLAQTFQASWDAIKL